MDENEAHPAPLPFAGSTVEQNLRAFALDVALSLNPPNANVLTVYAEIIVAFMKGHFTPLPN